MKNACWRARLSNLGRRKREPGKPGPRLKTTRTRPEAQLNDARVVRLQAQILQTGVRVGRQIERMVEHVEEVRREPQPGPSP